MIQAKKLTPADKVKHREFPGAFVRYRIETGGAIRTADQPHRGGQADFAAGDAVLVSFDTGQIQVLTE